MKFRILLVLALVIGFTSPAFAAGGHDHGHTMDKKASSDHSAHGTASKDEHAGMAMGEGMIMVGSQVSKGVKGMAHLNDVSEAMAKAGMKATHHFMIAFAEEKTGTQIEQGTVALKVVDPDGKVMETIELMGMDGHFGADVELSKEGEYHFRLGTKLADGVQRKYHFHQVIKR